MTSSPKHYAQAGLLLYVRMPGTPRRGRPSDRRLLEQLHSRGVPLSNVEAALLLASARRICRDPAKPPLPPVRSLAYFLPVIDELARAPLSDTYLNYIRSKVTLKPPP